ncbi:hypothetical protein GCM10009547_31050 [Sporichthya brevicatena]|uniref:LysM domain-containing protein n=1 Tax=Sporichthya brevicatena TaxID=171442 RepID=A0ABP3S8E0_9ACTN
MNGTLNHTAHATRHATARAHLHLVPTPTAAELEDLVARPASAASAAPLRLTRRGRLVVVVLFLGALLAGGVLFGSTSTRASGEAGPARTYEYLVVQPGDTLWGIAKQVAPNDDPRATIEAIRRLNALSDGGVQAGQRIALP